jgi:hypothetical protein
MRTDCAIPEPVVESAPDTAYRTDGDPPADINFAAALVALVFLVCIVAVMFYLLPAWLKLSSAQVIIRN